MKNRKFLMGMLLILLPAGFLSAAGQDEDQEASKTLEVYAFAGPIKEAFWQEAVKEFNTRFPETEVVLTVGPKINDQVRINIAAGNLPDVYFSAGAGKIAIPQLVAEDLIAPLDVLLGDRDWTEENRFLDTILPGRVQQLDGTVYGVEVPFHLGGFFYHEPTFQAQGWEVPRNFEEFQALAPRIQAAGMSPLVTTGIYPYYYEHFVMRGSVAADGGSQAALDWVNLKPGFFTSSVFRGGVEKLEWTIQNGYLMRESMGLNHTASQAEWVHGKAAFIPTGTWLESEMQNDFPEGFAEGIRFLPSFMINPGRELVVTPYGNAPITVFKGENQEMAMEFVKALYSPQVMAKLTEITNIMSNIPEANRISRKSPAITSAVDWLESAPSLNWPVGGYSTQDVTKAIQGNIQGLMSRQVSVDEFCANVEAAAEAVRKDSSITYFQAYIP